MTERTQNSGEKSMSALVCFGAGGGKVENGCSSEVCSLGLLFSGVDTIFRSSGEIVDGI